METISKKQLELTGEKIISLLHECDAQREYIKITKDRIKETQEKFKELEVRMKETEEKFNKLKINLK